MKRWGLYVGLFFLSAAAQGEEARVSSFCNQVLSYQASDDVNYKPGVDVHGNAVVPADVGGIIDLDIIDPVRIPLKVNLADYLDLGFGEDGLELEPVLGEMQVFQDGRILFNGRDISSRVLDACEDRDDVGLEPAPAGISEPRPSGVLEVAPLEENDLPKADESAIESEVLDAL